MLPGSHMMSPMRRTNRLLTLPMDVSAAEDLTLAFRVVVFNPVSWRHDEGLGYR